MAENPEPSDAADQPRPSLRRAAQLLDEAEGAISFDRANCLATQAIAEAVVCQAIAAEQQVKILAGIRDRLDVMIRAERARSSPRALLPIPPFPYTSPTASAR